MRSIFLKELSSFFSSVVGYVSIGVFLIASGLFCWVLEDSSIVTAGAATLDRFFELAPWLLLLLIPAVTMRMFADEYRSGTIEWLATKPVSDLSVILGKYFASLVLVAIAILPTLVYAYSIDVLAAEKTSIDYGAIAGSYAGLLFLAAGFAAVGVFCSSLASNQVVSFLVALFACFILYSGFEGLNKVFSEGSGYGYYISMAGMNFHYNSISRGIIDSRDVVYFLSVVVLFIALTRFSLRRRTWDTAD